MSKKKILGISLIIGLLVNIGVSLLTAKQSCTTNNGNWENSLCHRQGGFPLKSYISYRSGDIVYPTRVEDILYPALDPKFWINVILLSALAFGAIKLIKYSHDKKGINN